MAAAVDQVRSRDMLPGGDVLALWAERTAAAGQRAATQSSIRAAQERQLSAVGDRGGESREDSASYQSGWPASYRQHVI
jgi:hypothetical protein